MLLQEAFLDLAVRSSPDLSIEVGAHEASFSIAMKKRLPDLEVMAFEANPYVFEKYSRALSEGAENPIRYEHLAICDRNGVSELKIPVSWPRGRFGRDNAISSLHPRRDERFEYEVVSVPARMLDSVLEDTAFESCVMWVDVEGAQAEVIAGSGDALSRTSVLLIEVENESVWVDQETASGVSCRLGQHGLIPVMQDNLARLQRNEVYMRPSKRMRGRALPVIENYIGALKRLA